MLGSMQVFERREFEALWYTLDLTALWHHGLSQHPDKQITPSNALWKK